ncbi:MAG: alpha/beta hydrolase [Clostridium sp.]|nr:alpha/beta hydrolase [Clostridium sp.]
MNTITPFKTITYATLNDLPLQADFYEAKGAVKHQTILYFHGGGLIYGSRSDLPESYLSQFIHAGYHVLTVDYPLTPECSFEKMMTKVEASLCWFLEDGLDDLPIKTTDYILFGRSAGAYLASYLTMKISLQKPSKLILLYGYYNLEDSVLTNKSDHYNKMIKIDSNVFNSLIQKNPISSGTVEKRYLMYLYLRQTGTWPFLREDLRRKYSISADDFKDFPQTFLAYSLADKDVPPTQSQEMASLIPSSQVFRVEGEKHDFDSDYTSPLAKELYREIIKWLDQDPFGV